ncbi:glycosyltransferase [uncultured Winogradskyella sp.]|uniref:glycosyltransferase n=1 Tax=uncultured Winogradskyella sp. TaxID=395353 RepID=UPI0026202196|nr:glycosyltransferase [uncultured Winogradskyella sp.]
MYNTIVHVLDVFPSRSETFIINHIIECERKGLKSIILVNTLHTIDKASQKNLINSYGLYDVAHCFNPKMPKHKVLRVLKALGLLLNNLSNYKVFLNTLNQQKYGLKAKTLKLWFQASVFLKYQKHEIFHGHFGVSGKVLADMKDIGAIKGDIITSFYGYDTFSVEENRKELQTYFKDVFKRSKLIVTSSNYLYANLLKLNAPEHKLLVNAVGVDVSKFPYRKREYNSELHIVTVGRLIELKGQAYGIDAVILLLQKGYNIKYTIIGHGDDFEDIKTKIHHSGYQNHIHLKGSGTQAEIAEVLLQSHVFLMTSITDTLGRAEGQGLVIAEAQATGLPVVAFNSGGIGDSITHNKTGYLVEEKNVKDMANSIEKFIDNLELINDMGYAAKCFVEDRFNSQKQSDKMIKQYK